MLTCQQMTKLMTEVLEGSLPWMDWARFRMHVGICRHCREYLRQIKLSVATLGRLPAEPVTNEVLASLLARFGNRAS